MARTSEISVLGLNQVRLINRLTADGVRLYRIEKLTPSELRIKVQRKDLSKVIAILQNLCYTYIVLEDADLLDFIRKRFWLPLAAVCLLAVILASNMFVWRVEISGASGITRIGIERMVSDAGYSAFSLKPTELSALRLSVMSLDNISAATVRMRGNVLSVEVIESTETVPLEKGGSVVSVCDGVVTRVVTESGTPLVRRGDVVRRGQTLIGGELTATADDSVIISVPARGSVYGTVTFFYSLILSDGIEWQKTGNIQKETDLRVFGLEWKGGEAGFDCYEARTETAEFFFFKVTQRVYSEVSASSLGADTEAFAAEKKHGLESIYSTEFSAKYITEEIGGIRMLKLYLSAELCLGQS